MCPHNVPWLTMEDLHLWDFIVDPYMTLDLMMKPYRALWNKKAPTQKKQRRPKKGKNNKKREPTSNQETMPKETTPKIANAQPGATKERERAMEWVASEVLHSFIPFISSLTFLHPKMSSIQKWPMKLPTKETQLRSKSGFFSVFQCFFDIENCQIFPKISRN
jgi:hypothetical protein